MEFPDLRIFPDPALRIPAHQVTEFDDSLEELGKMLAVSLNQYGGVGIAAPQIGYARRVIAVAEIEEVRNNPGNAISAVLVNPVIVAASEESWVAEEGCLSVPDIKVSLRRPMRITVSAYTVFGTEISPFEIDHWEARLFQHEIDHLNGVLHFDRLPDLERKKALRMYARNRASQEIRVA